LLEKILIPILVALLSSYLSIKVWIRFEKRKLIREFHSGYYQDLWGVIQNVNGVIQRGRIISEDNIMNPIEDKYSTSDITSYLQYCVRTKDKKLKELLNEFSMKFRVYQNTITSSEGMYVKELEKYKELFGYLTDEIQKRIEHLIVK